MTRQELCEDVLKVWIELCLEMIAEGSPDVLPLNYANHDGRLRRDYGPFDDPEGWLQGRLSGRQRHHLHRNRTVDRKME